MTLILASKSRIRAALLENAGIAIAIDAADIDERATEQEAVAAGADASAVAVLLARAKAVHVSARNGSALVIGADQTLSLDGQRFSKPKDRDAAAEQLKALRGKTHMLASSVAIARSGEVVWSGVSCAHLGMRDFSDSFLASYLDLVGDAPLTSVGGYQLEGPGIQLFERIEGDYFTILGMPMLLLLPALRDLGVLEG